MTFVTLALFQNRAEIFFVFAKFYLLLMACQAHLRSVKKSTQKCIYTPTMCLYTNTNYIYDAYLRDLFYAP